LVQLLPAPAFWFTRYLVVVPRPLIVAALVVRRRYLAVGPRPMPAAPRRYLIVVPRSLPRRRGAVAAEKSKLYPYLALNYPGARNHDFCQL
jgi:hypothetical protein